MKTLSKPAIKGSDKAEVEVQWAAWVAWVGRDSLSARDARAAWDALKGAKS